MLKNISIYSIIGVVNTGLHWVVFYFLHENGLSQSNSNVVAFIMAVTFSFFMNAKFNFKSEVNKSRYICFLSGMGTLSYLTGFVADYFMLSPLITLISFSGISYLLGFFYSKYFVFR